MRNCEYHNQLAILAKNDLIRKPAQSRPPHVFRHQGKLSGIFSNAVKSNVQFVKETFTKAFLPKLVPRVGFMGLRQGLIDKPYLSEHL